MGIKYEHKNQIRKKAMLNAEIETNQVGTPLPFFHCLSLIQITGYQKWFSNSQPQNSFFTTSGIFLH